MIIEVSAWFASVANGIRNLEEVVVEMYDAKWLYRLTRRWHSKSVRDDGIQLGLIRMEDRVLLDAAAVGAASSLAPDGASQAAPSLLTVAPISVASAVTVPPSTLEVSGDELIFEVSAAAENYLTISLDDQHITFHDRSGIPIDTSIAGGVGGGTDRVSVPFSSLDGVDRLVVDLGLEEDSVTFDLSQHSGRFLSQFTTAVLEKSEDRVVFIGDGSVDATYQLAVRPRTEASVEITNGLDEAVFTFSFSDSVDFTGMNTATLVTPAASQNRETLTVSEGVAFHDPNQDALIVDGNTGNLFASDARFYGNTTVAIRAGVISRIDATVIVEGAANQHQNTNLILDTGTDVAVVGGDRVALNGAIELDGTLEITTGTAQVSAPVRTQTLSVHSQGDLDFLASARVIADAVRLTSVDGQVTSLVQGTSVISSDVIDILAHRGVGVVNPFTTSANSLQINVTGSGPVRVLERDDITLADIRVTNGFIEISANGSISAGNVIGTGPITLTARDSIVLNQSVRTEHGDIALHAGRNIRATGTAEIVSSSGDVSLITDDRQGGSVMYDGVIRTDGNLVFRFPGDSGRLSGAIGGAAEVMKEGAGTLTITGQSRNTYSGKTTIAQGTLVVDGIIDASEQVVLAANTTLLGSGNINAPIFSQEATAAIIPTGGLVVGDGSAAAFDFAGTMRVGSSRSITIRDSDLAQLGRFTELAAGGTIVASNGVEVGAGDMLVGGGRLAGDLVVRQAGSFTPGTPSGRSTSIDGSLILDAGATLNLSIDGQSASLFDHVFVSDTVSVQGAVLNLTGGNFRLAPGAVITLLSNSGDDAVVGNFVDTRGVVIAEGDVIRVGAIEANFSYLTDPGQNDISLTSGDQLFFIPLDPGGDGDRLTGFFIPVSTRGDLPRRVEAVRVVISEQDNTVSSVGTSEVTITEVELEIEDDFRLFFTRYDDTLQREGSQEYQLDADALTNIPEAIKSLQLPDGHYKVYLQEAGSSRIRLLMHVYIREGDVVAENFEPGANDDDAQDQNDLPDSGAANRLGDITVVVSGSDTRPAAKDATVPVTSVTGQREVDVATEGVAPQVSKGARLLRRHAITPEKSDIAL